jgi:hypothetical protein
MRTLARPSDRAEILRRLRTLRPERAARWGRMSAPQMICHLADSFRMAIGERSVAIHTSALKRTLLKWIVLYVPAPWPPGIDTSPEIDQERGGTKPVEFAADLARVEGLLETFTACGTLGGQDHPVFGAMSEPEWLRWGWLHTDHHLRQFGA